MKFAAKINVKTLRDEFLKALRANVDEQLNFKRMKMFLRKSGGVEQYVGLEDNVLNQSTYILQIFEVLFYFRQIKYGYHG